MRNFVLQSLYQQCLHTYLLLIKVASASNISFACRVRLSVLVTVKYILKLFIVFIGLSVCYLLNYLTSKVRYFGWCFVNRISSMKKGIFIIGAKRTPFCGHGGLLREVTASHAFAAAAKDAINSANVDPKYIDNTVVGNVHFLSQCDGGKTPRYCGIYSRVPLDRPALGVNKACGSGLQAIITGAVDILTGSAKISLTGGTEIMSALPMLVRNIRFGAPLGSSHQMEDYIQREFRDSYVGLTSQRMAEELAKKYGVSRQEADEYALLSHMRWKAAHLANVFTNELTPLTATIKKKEVLVDKDDISYLFTAARPQELDEVPPLLEGGSVVTTGNSAAPADGAAAILLADEDSVRRHNLTPLARVVSWSCVGVNPVETGLSAVAAIRSIVKEQKSLDAVDLFEINEMFATETLVTAKELHLDLDKTNVSGGAIVLGHPVAASGARMVTRLVYELSRRSARTAVAASSCGSGQGVAIMLEKV